MFSMTASIRLTRSAAREFDRRDVVGQSLRRFERTRLCLQCLQFSQQVSIGHLVDRRAIDQHQIRLCLLRDFRIEPAPVRRIERHPDEPRNQYCEIGKQMIGMIRRTKRDPASACRQ
jgi:hypothetical protein